MKNILLLIGVCMMICTAQSAFAAFAVKPAVVYNPAPAIKPAAPAATTTTEHKTGLAYRIRQRLHTILMAPKLYGIHNVRGIFGTLALVFGILSFIPIYGYLFGAAAIVLGCIGIHKHNKLAVLGLVLGCAGILANTIYLAIIIIESLQGFAIGVF